MSETTQKPIKPTKKPRSINARMVAQDVINRVRQGKKVNMQEIQKAHGYSDFSAKAMKATRTKTYKEEMQTFLSKMERVRDKTLMALDKKDLDEAKIFDLNLLLKNLNHDIALIRGNATENIAIAPSVVVYGSDDFLAMQMKKKENEGK